MIILNHRVSPVQLSNLGCKNLAIQTKDSTPGKLTAFFDFKEILILDSHTCDTIWGDFSAGNLQSKQSFSGWVGFFGYEFLAHHFGVQLHAKNDLSVPSAWFGRPQSLVTLEADQTIIESSDDTREQEVAKLLQKPISGDISISPSQAPTCNLSFKEYEDIFLRAREAILDGDTYQIKISQRFEAETAMDPLSAFCRLQQSNPAPEAFLLSTSSFSLISCSPEVVIHKTNENIMTRPIGGTYRRDSKDGDQSLIERFLRDPKEVAEHNMLVDLERNDLSAICQQGSVQIQNFREVESYSHLHHLVSTISGRLKANTSLQEIVEAMLPGGSITGCPKARTMEWIDRLEPCFRGPYTGSFGTISDNGDIHLNLIIRAMLMLDGRCYTQAGGGIVVNSTPEYEYQENQTKAQALLDLLK